MDKERDKSLTNVPDMAIRWVKRVWEKNPYQIKELANNIIGLPCKLNIAQILVPNQDFNYLGNNWCHSICILPDIHTDDYYIHWQIQFQCIAYRLNMSDRLSSFLLRKQCYNQISETCSCTYIIHKTGINNAMYLRIDFHCIDNKYSSM